MKTVREKIDEEGIYNLEQFKKDLLFEFPDATEGMFDFAWKWGLMHSPNICWNKSDLMNIFECFVDIVTLKG